MMKRLRNYWDLFLMGVLAVMPIVVILQVVVYTERLLQELFRGVYSYAESYWTTWTFFGLSIVFLIYVGYLIRHDKAYVMYLLESFINKIPLLGTLYRVVKKLFAMFGGEGDNRLREVVYVEYPRPGLWVPAYVTNRHGDMYVLFIPTSPNPTSGFTVIVNKSMVKPSAMTIEEASGFVISVGTDFRHGDEVSKLE